MIEDYVEDYFDIGTIVNVHGVRGEVRVMPSTDDYSRFELLEDLEVFFGPEKKIFTLKSARPHKTLMVMVLAGVNDRDAAKELVGGVIKVPRSLALPLDDDEYYQKDLLDMQVLTDKNEELGILTRIIETGANDVYVVRPKSGDKDILIPAIKECILSVSVNEKKMTVHLMEGLREL